MANELVKRMVKKDGSQRISFYRDKYAENPRDMTDEPLHCEDWSRDYSIMDKHERETKSENARNLIRYLLQRYGNSKKIIKLLKGNYKGSEHDRYENGLSYDRSRKEWIVWSWQPTWKDYQGNVYEAHWAEEWAFCTNIYDVDIYNIADYLSDEQIDAICKLNLFTDKVKIMSYGFGYNGDISFYHEFSTDSEGICWLEKDEFLKYSGNDEEYWNSKTLDEIDPKSIGVGQYQHDVTESKLSKSLDDVVEDAVKYKTTRKCLSGNGKDEEYEETEWEEKGLNSCWGFYGELDKVESWIFEESGLNKEEFEEVA